VKDKPHLIVYTGEKGIVNTTTTVCGSANDMIILSPPTLWLLATAGTFTDLLTDDERGE